MADVVDSKLKSKLGWRQVLRFSLVLLGLFCCYRLIVGAATAGLSRLLQTTSIIQAKVQPADIAVRLTPGDPEARYTRGLALVNLGRLDEAVAELRQATLLRPRHYYEWLDLGVTLDRLGDQTGADAAIRESVRLAPSFAQPHWQLGNLLFRQGRYQEAFAELRRAARSNPNLFEGLLDLAWVAAEGDVGIFESLVQPQNGSSHIELARFLAVNKKWSDAARHARDSGEPGDDRDRALLRQTITRLLAAEQFSDAYVAWAPTHPLPSGSGTKGQFLNGDFTQPIIQDDPGFGWQLVTTPNVSASVDPSGPSPGVRSLCLAFGGDSAPSGQLISQLVLLEPNRRYSLAFVARADELVSGGLPVIIALDAGNKPTKVLAQSKPLSPVTREWSAYQLDFSTEPTTSAVIIAVQRLPCSQSPCPIFGKLWLSGFSLVKT